MKNKYLIFGLVLLIASCEHPEEKKFFCGTCENEMHGQNSVTDTIDCEGKTLFKKNCAACHTVSHKQMTGPGLISVLSRIPSREWAYGFIKNADSVIKSGDAYANKIYEKYNRMQQTKFSRLSNKEIDAILDYCDAARCH